MKNKNVENKVAVSPSVPLIGSADGHGGNAERFTPEQRADAIIQVLYADTPPPMQFELRDSIAAEIREAVELEREDCFRIASDHSTEGFCSSGVTMKWHIGKLIRERR